jgi:hypothetical protein
MIPVEHGFVPAGGNIDTEPFNETDVFV